MYRAFSQDFVVSPLVQTIPAYFGKFCLKWPTFAFMLGNNEIFTKIRLLNRKKFQRSSTQSKVRFFFE
jgi:hypothetical protein